ncbi:transposase, partial [Pseudoflavonifractor phocaeensis]|nr:transposase [Pseudoflavonifractor phocaeensis]
HTHWRYHLQLILEGVPPAKPKRKVVDAVAGIDIGPSTVAAASQCGVLLQELGAEVNSIETEIARLDRKMDRQRRANNPDNYDSLGRIKRLKKGERRVWHYSNGYYKTRAKRRTLYAKRKALLKQSHTMLANYLLEHLGNLFFVEKMSIAGLSKRSRKNKTNKKTGRPRSKRRFGKSIQNHAPSQFIDILARKAKACGGDVIRVDPTPLKASQYDHSDNTYKKASLNQRTKMLSNGDKVQRDLYSAFLLSCLDALDTISRSKCSANYSKFKYMHDILIQELRRQKAAGAEFPRCMGI